MVKTFLLLLVLALVAVAAVNSWVDPLGVVRGNTARTVSEEPLYRIWKTDLIDQLPRSPEVVLLGSSTMRDVDPVTVSRYGDGAETFNAAVPGGTPHDAYVTTRYLSERFPDGPLPHLIYGIDVDLTFREADPSPALLRDERLREQLTTRERAQVASRLYRPYLSLRTLRTSVRVATQGGERPPLKSAREVFRSDGFRLWDPYRHASLRRRLPRETARYAELIYRSGEYRTLATSQQRYLDRLVQLANSRGERPTLVLMPVHPYAQRMLEPLGWHKRRQLVLDHLRGLERQNKVEVVDLTSVTSFGGSAVGFWDNVHVTTDNAERLVAELGKRGQLSPAS